MNKDTITSGAADLPEALRLAAAISNLLCSNEAAARTLAAAADELVRLHAESEMRRAALLDEMQKAALAAGQATAAQAGEYPALVCDYCGALTPDPWHSSGMLHGKMSKHIHSCDACADDERKAMAQAKRDRKAAARAAQKGRE